MNGIKGLLAALTLYLLAACNQNAKIEDDNLYRIMVGDKYGFMDARGKIVIEPQFDEANEVFSEGVCFVKTENRRGLIDKSGFFVAVLPDTIEYVGDFKGGLSRALNGMNRRGVINKHGILIIPTIYDNSEVNIEGDSVFALAWNIYGDEDWIIVDQNGATIEKRKNESVLGFENGLCRTHIGNKWGYINKHGELVIDTLYDYAYDFTEDGIARVEKNNEQLFIDKSGRRLFTPDRIIRDMVCNRATVIINGEKCLVDKTGRKICSIDSDFTSVFSSKDGLATIEKDGKTAKIDTMGNVILSSNYEGIGPFVGGIAAVEGQSGYGFIDALGNSIIDATNNDILDELYDEKYSLRAVWNRKNDVWCLSYYDLRGNLIWKDIPTSSTKKMSFYVAEKEEYVEYFDARIADLDPIEGIYYVTSKDYYQDRDNLSNIGQNDTESDFWAVVYNEHVDGYVAYVVNDSTHWVNKFVKIGNSNSYAIQKIDKENDYSKEGRVSIDDFNKFDFRLDLGYNDYYNFFATYEFVRDYPTVAEMEKFQQAEWTGTGFAIADGYIVTNYHVTNGAKTIRIKGMNGNMEEAYKGFVVASDKEHDLSIIKIVDKDFEGFEAIPYKIGKTTVDVGDDIFVLGYPMTQTMGEEVKLTNGVISAASGYKGDASMYQISAAVQSGNSGGPLFNEDGVVIGIVCAKHAGAENANYAVKVSYLYSLIASSNLGIDISGNDKVKGKSLSKQVKRIKDFVYLIECSSK